jgi:hypothetical protein
MPSVSWGAWNPPQMPIMMLSIIRLSPVTGGRSEVHGAYEKALRNASFLIDISIFLRRKYFFFKT